jgi:uncharacterized protein (TIGR00730 family)
MSERADLNWVCAFCGSNGTSNSVYDETVRQFAHELAARDIGLVYGGGRGGSMGRLADEVLANSGEVVGIIPESILEREQPHEGLTELRTTDTKSARKEQMSEYADGFVALPGGIGTHEEMFDVLGRAKHGFHRKPCGLLNVSGYYDNLIDHLDHAASVGFLSPEQRELALVDSDPASLLDAFEQYESPIDAAE